MDLGAFSISLTVKDMAASRSFYEKLGFRMMGGDGETWTITMNESKVVIGLFHGMFDSNLLTFNPGWAAGGEALETFTDIREISAQLNAAGIETVSDVTGDSASGPASFSVVDPDGNIILVDQHV
ncbi:MAG: VOC family protein [Acidimicrobiales bacterium]|nr:VOC family protein [Acidimicrobiales bacterium]